MLEPDSSALPDLYAEYESLFKSLIQKQNRQFRRSMWIWETVILVLAVLAMCALHRDIELPVLLFFWFFAAILIPVILQAGRSSEQNKVFKINFIPRILQLFDSGLKYHPSGFVSEAEAQKSGLIRGRIDRYSGQDLVCGTYQGVEIEFSEILAMERHTTRDSKGNTHTTWQTLFKGVLMRGIFHKNFRHRHFILPDLAERFFGRLAGNFLQSMNFSVSGRVTRLEDPEFEKKYAVYSEDAVEVRYLITPKFMRILLDLNKQFGNGTSVSFVDDSIYLALPMKRNLFEYEGGKPSPERFSKVLNDFRMILSVLDSLDLDLRIWSKE